MGGQVTTLLHRLRVGGDLPAPLPARGLPGADDDAAAPSDGPPGRLLARAVAATGRAEAEAALGTLWSALAPGERRAVVDPVRHLGRALRQHDRTTCGSAALVVLAALGDPFLAAWLVSGRLPATAALRPPELAGAPSSVLEALAGAPTEQRAGPLQRVVKHRTNGCAVAGVLPWPPLLGTPPWGAARTARFAPVRYRAVVLDDTDRAHLARVLDLVGHAVAAGVPVPLYTGGDTRTGWGTALPRHVVLAVGATDDGLALWEPASGRCFDVPRRDLLAPSGPTAALGGWTHLAWAVLPVGPSR